VSLDLTDTSISKHIKGVLQRIEAWSKYGGISEALLHHFTGQEYVR